MGGRLLKKLRNKHLTDFDIMNAADGYESRRVAKHIDRCVHCIGRVRHLENERQQAKDARHDQVQIRLSCLRQAAVSHLLKTRPFPIPSPLKLPGPRLLSGAEWEKIKRWSTVPAICLSLLVGLAIAMTRVAPEDRFDAHLLLILFSVGIVAVICMIEFDDNDDDDY